MAVRKKSEETLVVEGPRDEWFAASQQALESQGFTKIEASPTLGQVSANYKKATTWGTLDVTLIPEGDSRTRLTLKATANVDNIYAAFRSPGKKIINAFKAGLPA